MATVLITGGSGLIGRHLTQRLLSEGHAVRWLSRSEGAAHGTRRFAWDIAKGTVDPRALEGAEHIIHLSGAGIAYKRWTATRLKELHASRSGAARLLLKAMKDRGLTAKSFIAASGIGYHGALTSDHIHVESDLPATDTLGRLTKDLEDAADEWSMITRVVKLRSAVVLAHEGGALPRLAAPVRYGAGAALGTGKQWMPWVHVEDLVGAYMHALANERMQGAYHVATSEQPTNAVLMGTIAKVLHRPFFLPNVPAFALKMVFGEMSAAVLEGSRVSNERLLDTGFVFRWPRLGPALSALLQ